MSDALHLLERVRKILQNDQFLIVEAGGYMVSLKGMQKTVGFGIGMGSKDLKNSYRDLLSGFVLVTLFFLMIFGFHLVMVGEWHVNLITRSLMVFATIAPAIILSLILNFIINRRRPIQNLVSYIFRFIYLYSLVFIGGFIGTDIVTRGEFSIISFVKSFSANPISNIGVTAYSGAVLGFSYWLIKYFIDRTSDRYATPLKQPEISASETINESILDESSQLLTANLSKISRYGVAILLTVFIAGPPLLMIGREAYWGGKYLILSLQNPTKDVPKQ